MGYASVYIWKGIIDFCVKTVTGKSPGYTGTKRKEVESSYMMKHRVGDIKEKWCMTYKGII